jgi:DNA-binding NarL/FixJ family response regulator
VKDLRVLVVGQDPLARGGLAAMLSSEPGFTVVGQSGSDPNLSAQLGVFKPDALVWDLGWEPTVALERLENLEAGGVPVLALLPDSSYAMDAWSAGARGLLKRNTDPSKLAAALSALVQGLTALDAEMGAIIRGADYMGPTDSDSALTPRELEVLQLLAEGLPNKEVAHRLNVSEHTVKFHVNAIMSKLNAQSRTDAVVRATRAGLIHL